MVGGTTWTLIVVSPVVTGVRSMMHHEAGAVRKRRVTDSGSGR
jgi:hypothetical protein